MRDNEDPVIARDKVSSIGKQIKDELFLSIQSDAKNKGKGPAYIMI